MLMVWQKWTIKILTTIIDKFKGDLLVCSLLATAVSKQETIEEVYEPFDSGRFY
jgi:Holliday junction resolvasome RuvABC ATP-dependent DNA helicase subunit